MAYTFDYSIDFLKELITIPPSYFGVTVSQQSLRAGDTQGDEIGGVDPKQSSFQAKGQAVVAVIAGGNKEAAYRNEEMSGRGLGARKAEQAFVLESIENIDQDIQNLFVGVNAYDEDIGPNTFGQGVGETGLQTEMVGGKSYESVHTSWNRNDCLIHAFLLSVSPRFRKLSQDQKDLYASWFRRSVFARTFDVATEPVLREQAFGNDFLEDTHGEKLISLYKINFITWQRDSGTLGVSLNYGIFNFDLYMAGNFILMYNPGLLHFRAVKEVPTNKYLFTNEEGKTILQKFGKVAYDEAEKGAAQRIPLANNENEEEAPAAALSSSSAAASSAAASSAAASSAAAAGLQRNLGINLYFEEKEKEKAVAAAAEEERKAAAAAAAAAALAAEANRKQREAKNTAEAAAAEAQAEEARRAAVLAEMKRIEALRQQAVARVIAGTASEKNYDEAESYLYAKGWTEGSDDPEIYYNLARLYMDIPKNLILKLRPHLTPKELKQSVILNLIEGVKLKHKPSQGLLNTFIKSMKEKGNYKLLDFTYNNMVDAKLLTEEQAAAARAEAKAAAAAAGAAAAAKANLNAEERAQRNLVSGISPPPPPSSSSLSREQSRLYQLALDAQLARQKKQAAEAAAAEAAAAEAESEAAAKVTPPPFPSASTSQAELDEKRRLAVERIYAKQAISHQDYENAKSYWENHRHENEAEYNNNLGLLFMANLVKTHLSEKERLAIAKQYLLASALARYAIGMSNFYLLGIQLFNKGYLDEAYEVFKIIIDEGLYSDKVSYEREDVFQYLKQIQSIKNQQKMYGQYGGNRTRKIKRTS